MKRGTRCGAWGRRREQGANRGRRATPRLRCRGRTSTVRRCARCGRPRPSGSSGLRGRGPPRARSAESEAVVAGTPLRKLTTRVIRQPITEAADAISSFATVGGAIGQPPGGEPAVRRWPASAAGRAGIGVAGHQLARLHGELPAVKEDDLELVEVRRPVLRAAPVALVRAVKEVRSGRSSKRRTASSSSSMCSSVIPPASGDPCAGGSGRASSASPAALRCA